MPKRPSKKPKNSSWDRYDINNPINQVANSPKQEQPPLRKLKKVAISGTACQGKSTLIKDMMIRWYQFTTPARSYRDIINEKGLTINKNGNAENQLIILNALVDQLMENNDQKVILDRCPLDNLIYTLWLNEKNPEQMPDNVVLKTIDIVRESMKMLDIIFFIPLTSVHKVPIVGDKLRETDPQYIEEIDNLFKAVINTQKLGIGKFFPIEDCPPIIEIFGDQESRIKIMEFYIDNNCEFVGADDNAINELASQAGAEYNIPEIVIKPNE